ncbi:MAG: NADH-quinone oxidoreductase subunit N [Chloroflexi bacterium]|nr:NADH-quinone oxidoreductase subunit N [Chloroflexota bacterium]
MNPDYSLLIPEYVLVGWAALVVGVEIAFPRLRKDIPAYLAALGALVAGIISVLYINVDKGFEPTRGVTLLHVDDYTTYMRVLLYGIAMFICLVSAQFVRMRLSNAGEYFGIILIATVGGIFMTAGTELITSWIALELLSFCLYTLVSFARRELRSNEGGLKYMLLGAFSTALFLYGLSLIYGVTGTTTYDGIAAALPSASGNLDWALLAGFVFIIAGLGFKVAAVPFHMYTPDAYEGAPLPITALLSTTSKAAAFALFFRLFSTAFQPQREDWRILIAIISALTMSLGNLVALQQHNLKRLFAYSSIGQVGFMLIAVAASTQPAGAALLFHMAGYAVTNLAAFTIFIVFYNHTGKEEISDLAGLAERAPFMAMGMTAALFSLAGMPLFAGFFTKFILFQSGWSSGLKWLAALAVVNSLISLYYYLMVIRQMYVVAPAEPGRMRTPVMMFGVVGALVVGIFFLGIWPTPLFEAANEAAAFLFPA